MAKKPDSKISPFVLAAMNRAQSILGKQKVYVAGDHEKHQWGIYIPALALRWLIDSTVWPLQRITQSAGVQSTFKSAFLFQLETWFLEAGGVVAHIDTENKTSSSFMYSIIPEVYFKDDILKYQLQFNNAATINEWMQVITGYVQTAKDHMKEYKTNLSQPILIAVDSMMGAGSDESKEHIEESGDSQGRGFSDASILISQYLRDLSSGLIGLPITVHFTHHEKKDVQGQGFRRAGGSAPDFYATLDLRFQKGNRAGEVYGTGDVDKKNLTGRTITMTVKKSSMGQDTRQLAVPIYWTYDEAQDGKQISWWDWPAALSSLLYSQRTSLKGACDIQSTKKDRIGDVYWSESLGITEKDPLTGNEFGKLFESNADLVEKVEKLLRIQKHQIFAPGALDV